ncbi:tyrosine-type recombinase/integrase [Streptomyces sp. NBC_01304]|uniref:tyrosine-type recombinase/integrase n=1 Tax=Streptomyces sp. NBC_01304 TaxID=2903818 RepID=UPI002E13E6BD|nr:hypothetical protein OG430_44470 [Streptomyces sp. NBC_01304]
MQLPDIWDCWKNDTENDYAARTIDGRIRVVERICRHHQLTDPHQLTEAHIRAFFTERGTKPSTRRTYLTAVKSFATWAGIPDPTAKIKRPKRARRRPKPVTETQRLQLLDYLKTHNRPMYVAALLALYAGLRAFEIGQLRGEHILPDPDGTGGILTVHDGKGDKTEDVQVDQLLIDELAPEIAAGGYVLGRYVTGNTVTSRFLYWAKAKAGVPASIHQLRHWFVTWTYRVKKDLIAARDQARHDSAGTTEDYIESDRGVARATARALPGASLSGTTAHVPVIEQLGSEAVELLRQQLTVDPEAFLEKMARLHARFRHQEQQMAAMRQLMSAIPQLPEDTP